MEMRDGSVKFCVDGMRLAQVLEFKYQGCVLDESGTDEVVSWEGYRCH